MNKIVPEFKNSLIIDSSELIQDYAEIGIDSFFDNEIVKEIPIIKSIMSTKKIINNIAERNLLKKLVIFINELNSGNINKKKIEEHRKALENPKEAEKELGRFLIILNQTYDNEKSILHAKVYKAYINQSINWEELVEFTEIINRIFIQDLNILKQLYMKNEFVVSNFATDRKNMFRIDRLYSLGVVGYSAKALYPGGGVENYANLNELGSKFANIIFE